MADTITIKCQSCDGEGKIDWRRSAYGDMEPTDCPDCDGKGELDIDIGLLKYQGDTVASLFEKSRTTLDLVAADLHAALDDLWDLHGNGFGTPYERAIASIQSVLMQLEVEPPRGDLSNYDRGHRDGWLVGMREAVDYLGEELDGYYANRMDYYPNGMHAEISGDAIAGALKELTNRLYAPHPIVKVKS